MACRPTPPRSNGGQDTCSMEEIREGWPMEGDELALAVSILAGSRLLE